MKLFDKLFKKVFWVPFKDVGYPSIVQTKCAIAEYCAKTNAEYTFLGDDKVIIDQVTYKIERKIESGSRGNYGIKCTEI